MVAPDYKSILTIKDLKCTLYAWDIFSFEIIQELGDIEIIFPDIKWYMFFKKRNIKKCIEHIRKYTPITTLINYEIRSD